MTPDVPGLLAEGRSAAADTETYVAACRRLGLTALSAEWVVELYGAEDGMRLDALDADAAALAAAAAAVQDALVSARAASGVLGQAWAGRTGRAAGDVLDQHCASAAHLVTGLRDAADTLRTLRARLQTLVEAKVEAAVLIDDRRSADRGRWLAQATAVLRGAADEAAADTVRGEISPYVDTDIAGQWVPAMLRCSDAVRAAYTDAASALNTRTPLRVATPAPARGSTVRTVRSRVSAPAPAPAPAPTPVSAPAAPPAIPPVIPAAADTSLPGGIGGAWSPLPSIPSPDRPRRTAKRGVRERDGAEQEKDDTVNDDDTMADHTAAVVTGSTPAEPAPPPGAPVPPPPPETPVAVEVPDGTVPPLAAEAPDVPPVDERTPCEIAADELPQVGE